jgi:site-specific recombinase XerD
MRGAADRHSSALVTSLARDDELGDGRLITSLPRVISNAGEGAAFHSLEFITARIANPNTRAAYGRAIGEFCGWCEQQGLSLPALSSPLVAVYFHELGTRLSASSTNQHLSAIRQWLEWLTRSGVLRFNPAATVRGARVSRQEGKTPVLDREQARRLFASFERPHGLIHRRDRAILAVMLYDFVRVGALVRMRARDFQEQGSTAWLVLREKGGKERRLPAHHLVREYVRAYVDGTGLNRREHAKAPLFQSAPGHAQSLSGKPLDRSAVLGIVKRRCRDVGLPASICNHSFRATGITLHQENGGDIEAAARLAGHADTRTTQLYNRSRRSISSVEVERIHI